MKLYTSTKNNSAKRWIDYDPIIKKGSENRSDQLDGSFDTANFEIVDRRDNYDIEPFTPYFDDESEIKTGYVSQIESKGLSRNGNGKSKKIQGIENTKLLEYMHLPDFAVTNPAYLGTAGAINVQTFANNGTIIPKLTYMMAGYISIFASTYEIHTSTTAGTKYRSITDNNDHDLIWGETDSNFVGGSFSGNKNATNYCADGTKGSSATVRTAQPVITTSGSLTIQLQVLVPRMIKATIKPSDYVEVGDASGAVEIVIKSANNTVKSTHTQFYTRSSVKTISPTWQTLMPVVDENMQSIVKTFSNIAVEAGDKIFIRNKAQNKITSKQEFKYPNGARKRETTTNNALVYGAVSMQLTTSTQAIPSNSFEQYIYSSAFPNNSVLTKIEKMINANRADSEKLVFGQAVKNLFDAVPCPEYQFKKNSVLQVLQTLFKEKNVVPFLGKNSTLLESEQPFKTITYAETNEQTTDDKAISVAELQIIDKHIDTLYVENENIIVGSSDITVQKSGTIAITNGELYGQILEGSNAVYDTHDEIYKIKNVFIKNAPINIGGTNYYGNFDKDGEPTSTLTTSTNMWDITSRVVAKEVFDALPDFNGNWTKTGYNICQGNMLYWTTSGQIGNLFTVRDNYPESVTGVSTKSMSLQWAVYYIAQSIVGSLPNMTTALTVANVINWHCEVWYNTGKAHGVKGTAGVAHKGIEKRANYPTQLANQKELSNNVFLDIKEQNNKSKTITVRIFGAESVPNAGEKYQDTDGEIWTITDVNESYIDNARYATYTLSKNYYIKNDLISVNNKYRQYEIPIDDYVVRFNEQITFNEITDYDGATSGTAFTKGLYFTLPSNKDDRITASKGEFAILRLYKNGAFVHGNEYPITVTVLGNSINRTIKMIDNTTFDIGNHKIKRAEGANFVDAYYNKNVSYTDNLGVMTDTEIKYGASGGTEEHFNPNDSVFADTSTQKDPRECLGKNNRIVYKLADGINPEILQFVRVACYMSEIRAVVLCDGVVDNNWTVTGQTSGNTNYYTFNFASCTHFQMQFISISDGVESVPVTVIEKTFETAKTSFKLKEFLTAKKATEIVPDIPIGDTEKAQR